ncbi:hypothetical protein LX77_01142 [Gelidibacter algens]|uniref:Uncharacterized protein n=1 Tax=Gelidibacter algens TaxID=49280 RepID=A0A327SIY0_9FLAO|nr:hypothetical protein LX77_01142 [Gelidibacter algens]
MIFLNLILLARFFLYIYATMIIQNKKILASFLLMSISFVCHTQTIGNGQMPPPPQAGPPNPPGFPIDDSLIFLFAAAIIYGAYMSFKMLKKKSHV